MKIHYRVQHVAGRDDALARALAKLPPVEVITDDARAGPFATYLRCLANPPARTTHLAIMQDDVLPSGNFEITLLARLKERPDDLLSLFVGGLPGQTTREFLKAMNRRERWVAIPRSAKITHVVALVWPVEAARSFLDWYAVNEERIPAPRPHRSDDAVFSYWLKTAKPWRTVWATVPCLVEHPDDVPSVAQPRRGGNGTDKGRRAIWFADAGSV